MKNQVLSTFGYFLNESACKNDSFAQACSLLGYANSDDGEKWFGGLLFF